MNPADYLLTPPKIDWPMILAQWRWMLPSSSTPTHITCFGDLFLRHDSAIWLLDLENATLDRYCETESIVIATLAQDEDADVLLYTKLVDQIRASGTTIGPGRCYHFKLPTILGGEFDLANIGTNSIDERIRFCGDFHRQIKDLPDGSPVRIQNGG